jgi:hypothetical protein
MSAALSDEEMAAALRTSRARLALATDAGSAARLLGLRRRTLALERVIGPDEAADVDDALIGLGPFFALADTLDTPERARAFRTTARGVKPDDVALWHFAPGQPLPARSLSHAQAMSAVREHLLALPAHAGDLAYIQGGNVALSSRLGCHAFIGDGYTTLALGQDGGASEEIPRLRPSKILANREWIEGLWSQVQATAGGWVVELSRRLPGVVSLRSWAGRPAVKRALASRLGDRVRWVEALQGVSGDVSHSLSRAGVRLVENMANAVEGLASHESDLPLAASGNRRGPA